LVQSDRHHRIHVLDDNEVGGLTTACWRVEP
jgi:hypothetical protein